MTHLQIGKKAPSFKGKDQHGNPISLEDYAGKKLILYFYPKDDTPGCTAETCDLRDNYAMWKSKGYEVLGVSIDPETRHRKFIEKYNIPFNLLADDDKKVVEKYGVWGEKNMYGRKYMGTYRTTFVIDENGVIEQIFNKVQTKTHTDQILAELS